MTAWAVAIALLSLLPLLYVIHLLVDRDKALIAFAESVQSSCVTLGRLVETLAAKVDAELLEIREGLAELDHTKARRREVEALHTRIDEMEGNR